MDKKKDEWINAAFESLEGIQRAQVEESLLASIENKIYDTGAKVMSIQQWKIAVAAAILLIIMNTGVLLQFIQEKTNTSTTPSRTVETYQVVSDYKLYD